MGVMRPEGSLALIIKKLRDDSADITREPLPARWVELIRSLDEQERTREQGRQAEPEPRGGNPRSN
jgi:hypothetical protein